jgi:hypothetical protein
MAINPYDEQVSPVVEELQNQQQLDQLATESIEESLASIPTSFLTEPIDTQNIEIGESTNLVIDENIFTYITGEEVENGRYNILINPSAEISFLPGSMFDGHDVSGQIVHNDSDQAMELYYHDDHLDLKLPGNNFDGGWYLCD